LHKQFFLNVPLYRLLLDLWLLMNSLESSRFSSVGLTSYK
jgi:hypothetical protein